MGNTERELMKRGKSIEEIDHRFVARIDAERGERLETVEDGPAAPRPRRKPQGKRRRGV